MMVVCNQLRGVWEPRIIDWKVKGNVWKSVWINGSLFLAAWNVRGVFWKPPRLAIPLATRVLNPQSGISRFEKAISDKLPEESQGSRIPYWGTDSLRTVLHESRVSFGTVTRNFPSGALIARLLLISPPN